MEEPSILREEKQKEIPDGWIYPGVQYPGCAALDAFGRFFGLSPPTLFWGSSFLPLLGFSSFLRPIHDLNPVATYLHVSFVVRTRCLYSSCICEHVKDHVIRAVRAPGTHRFSGRPQCVSRLHSVFKLLGERDFGTRYEREGLVAFSGTKEQKLSTSRAPKDALLMCLR
ncbi:hypothetical protein VTK73DRAFT_3426 [Phialemonium thermophilum]|uniref:Uncharacterized protein n=1 Tax=Phialemonium thermophilum TaxID=223376 RepID=A0ABR3X001_9PEZI